MKSWYFRGICRQWTETGNVAHCDLLLITAQYEIVCALSNVTCVQVDDAQHTKKRTMDVISVYLFVFLKIPKNNGRCQVLSSHTALFSDDSTPTRRLLQCNRLGPNLKPLNIPQYQPFLGGQLRRLNQLFVRAVIQAHLTLPDLSIPPPVALVLLSSNWPFSSSCACAVCKDVSRPAGAGNHGGRTPVALADG